MSQDTEEARPGEEPVAYQSISFSDEDEEEQQEVTESKTTIHVSEAPPASDENPGGGDNADSGENQHSIPSAFTNLKKIDEICGQVSLANMADGDGNSKEAESAEGTIEHRDNGEMHDAADGEDSSMQEDNKEQKDNGGEDLKMQEDILAENACNTQENDAGKQGEMDDNDEKEENEEEKDGEEEDHAEHADGDGNITSDEADEMATNTDDDGDDDEDDENTFTVDVPTYTCKLCKAYFTDQQLVESHLMVEHDLGEQTALFNVLPGEKKKKRVWRKGKDGYFHCLFCTHRSRRSINVREHEKQKHQKEELPAIKEYSCKLCSQHFALQDVFSHIQSDHPAEADSMNFVGNSLTEHYSVNFTTESRQITDGECDEDDPETLELSEDGFYHCGKCEFCSQELDAFTEHYKEHSLSNATYHCCQQCPYKNKSLRGLHQHEKMQHMTTSIKKRYTICSACGEKRHINHVHNCLKASKRGRKPSLLRNPEGHLMCADCTFTAKDYNAMYLHMKESSHQAQRDPSVGVGHHTPTPKGMEIEENSEGPRLLRGKKSDDTTMDADTTKDNANGDWADSVNDEGNADQDRAMAVALEELNESDYSQESDIDDSDDDPEWAPSLKGTPPRKTGRRSRTPMSDSDWDSDDPTSSRKRRPSSEENGHSSKRRRLADIPKDPDSGAPKKLESGMYRCNFCEFESKYGHSTEAHQWRHTGFRPYKCEACHRGFRQRLSMEKHNCSGAPPIEGCTGIIPKETLPISSAILLTAGNATPASQLDTVLIPDKQQVTPSVETPRQSTAGGASPDHPTPTETAALGNEEGQKGPSESPSAIEKPTSDPSPMPIIIAPPLPIESGAMTGRNVNDGRNISQAIDLDGDDNDVVCNLDGNEDMPPPSQTPPHGMHHPMGSVGQVGMSSPVGTPLNITPISGLDHHTPHMGGMEHYPSPDESRFGMSHTPQSMMDMPDHMINPMPGMMGEAHVMPHHGETLSLQHQDPAAMHHHMNPMGGHSMLESGPQFQNSDVGILDHLNLMPNTMLPSGSGFAVPQPTPPLSSLDSNMMSMNNNQFGSMQIPLYNNSIPSTFGNMGNTDPIDVDAEPISAFTPPATTSQSVFEPMAQSSPSMDSLIDMNRLDANSATQPQDNFSMNPTSTPGTHPSMSANAVVSGNPQPDENVAPVSESIPDGQALSCTVANSPLSSTTTPPLQQTQTTTPSTNTDGAPTTASTDSPMLVETVDQQQIATALETGTSTPTSGVASPAVQTPPQLATSIATAETVSTTPSPPSHGNQISEAESTAGVTPTTANTMESRVGTESVAGVESMGGMENSADTDNTVGTENVVGTENAVGTENTTGVENTVGAERTASTKSAVGTENVTGTETAAGTESVARTETAAGIVSDVSTESTAVPEGTTVTVTADTPATEGTAAPSTTVDERPGGGSGVGESNRDNEGSLATAETVQMPETSGTPPVVPEPTTVTPISVVPAIPPSTIPGGIALSGTDEAPPPLTITSVTGSLVTGVPLTLTGKSITNESGKTINDLFKCILCRVYFEDQQMYRNHMVHHGGAIGTCRICGRMFRTPLLFMNHLHCSAQCKGVNVNVPTPQIPMRGRGRSRGVPAQTVSRQMYATGQVPSVRARMRIQSPIQTTAMVTPSRMSTTSIRGTTPLQAMRQMSPTTGRRGRPPIGGRGGGAYGAALMRQPLQQQHFSTQLQQMGAMRGRAIAPRPAPVSQRQQRQPAPLEDIVIVID